MSCAKFGCGWLARQWMWGARMLCYFVSAFLWCGWCGEVFFADVFCGCQTIISSEFHVKDVFLLQRSLQSTLLAARDGSSFFLTVRFDCPAASETWDWKSNQESGTDHFTGIVTPKSAEYNSPHHSNNHIISSWFLVKGSFIHILFEQKFLAGNHPKKRSDPTSRLK